MTDMRERMIDLIEDAIDNVHDIDVTHRGYAEASAAAIIAALPDMVPELEWDKHPDEDEWYSILPEIKGDTLERGYMILPSGKGFCLFDGFASRRRKIRYFIHSEEAKAAANAYRRASIMAAFGLAQA